MKSYSKFIKKAVALGADDAKIIKTDTIVTGPWVRWKCKYGCDGYNSSLCCPPNTPDYRETRELVDSYEKALLVHCTDDIKRSTDLTDDRRHARAGHLPRRALQGVCAGRRPLQSLRRMLDGCVQARRQGPAVDGKLRHRRVQHGAEQWLYYRSAEGLFMPDEPVRAGPHRMTRPFRASLIFSGKIKRIQPCPSPGSSLSFYGHCNR